MYNSVREMEWRVGKIDWSMMHTGGHAKIDSFYLFELFQYHFTRYIILVFRFFWKLTIYPKELSMYRHICACDSN
jgi:hypothetical protein